jgi:hypothetical protein
MIDNRFKHRRRHEAGASVVEVHAFRAAGCVGPKAIDVEIRGHFAW